jgi:hypothetical protein
MLIEIVRDLAELTVETRHLQIGDAELAEGKRRMPLGMSLRELDFRISRVEAWQRDAVTAEESESEHPLAMADEIMKNYKEPDWLFVQRTVDAAPLYIQLRNEKLTAESVEKFRRLNPAQGVNAEVARETARDLVTFETDPAPWLSDEFRAKLEDVEPLPLAEAERINLDHLELRLVKSVVVLQSNLAAIVKATEIESAELRDEASKLAEHAGVLRGAMLAIVDHLKEGIKSCRFIRSPMIDRPGEEKITGVTVEPIQWERIQQALDFAMKALDGKPTVAAGASQALRDIRETLQPGPDKPPAADLISEALRLCDAALMPRVQLEPEGEDS